MELAGSFFVLFVSFVVDVHFAAFGPGREPRRIGLFRRGLMDAQHKRTKAWPHAKGAKGQGWTGQFHHEEHEGHEELKGRMRLVRFFFVLFVSFVVDIHFAAFGPGREPRRIGLFRRGLMDAQHKRTKAWPHAKGAKGQGWTGQFHHEEHEGHEDLNGRMELVRFFFVLFVSFVVDVHFAVFRRESCGIPLLCGLSEVRVSVRFPTWKQGQVTADVVVIKQGQLAVTPFANGVGQVERKLGEKPGILHPSSLAQAASFSRPGKENFMAGVAIRAEQPRHARHNIGGANHPEGSVGQAVIVIAGKGGVARAGLAESVNARDRFDPGAGA
jgi:hypothetical protein